MRCVYLLGMFACFGFLTSSATVRILVNVKLDGLFLGLQPQILHEIHQFTPCVRICENLFSFNESDKLFTSWASFRRRLWLRRWGRPGRSSFAAWR